MKIYINYYYLKKIFFILLWTLANISLSLEKVDNRKNFSVKIPQHLLNPDLYNKLNYRLLNHHQSQFKTSNPNFNLANLLQDKSQSDFMLKWIEENKSKREYVKNTFKNLKNFSKTTVLSTKEFKIKIAANCNLVLNKKVISYFNFISSVICLNGNLVAYNLDSKNAYYAWKRLYTKNIKTSKELLARANISRNIYTRIYVIDFLTKLLELNEQDLLLSKAQTNELVKYRNSIMERVGYKYNQYNNKKSKLNFFEKSTFKGSCFTTHIRSLLEIFHLKAGLNINRTIKEPLFVYFDNRNSRPDLFRRNFHLNLTQIYSDFIVNPSQNNINELVKYLRLFINEYFFDLIIHYSYNKKFHVGSDAIAPYNYFTNIGIVARALLDLQKIQPANTTFVKHMAKDFLNNLWHLHVGNEQGFVTYNLKIFKKFEKTNNPNNLDTIIDLPNSYHFEAIAYLIKTLSYD